MRYGSVHSSGKSILPIGDSVGFRFMLDDYQKGNFWKRTIADHDAAAGPMYPDRRTYLKQLQDAVKENAQEIFICIDTPGNNFRGVAAFAFEITVKLRELGYENELILGPPNEPLEHMSVTEYAHFAYDMSEVSQKNTGVKLSIGGMASEFTDFYRRIAAEIPYYDYIDFHTSNDGNIWSISWLINNMPADKPLINSEHYLLNCAQYYGYNHDNCLSTMKLITDSMFASPRIKSIYVTVPSIYKENPDDKLHVLRYVDKNNNVIMTTKMWYLLKLYEEGKEVMAELKELKQGDKGYQVVALQKILNEHLEPGIEPKETATKKSSKAAAVPVYTPLAVDGAFGPITAAAVNQYRKSVGFTENGVCSYSVWYMLLTTENIGESIFALFELIKVI